MLLWMQNGKSLRSLKIHNAAVLCLNWVEDGGDIELTKDAGYVASYEDRTSRFFPPAPRVPRLSGVVGGDSSSMDNSEDSFQDLLNTSHQQFNILCSADKEGGIRFSIFGIFPIGNTNIHSLSLPLVADQVTSHMLQPSIFKVLYCIQYYRRQLGRYFVPIKKVNAITEKRRPFLGPPIEIRVLYSEATAAKLLPWRSSTPPVTERQSSCSQLLAIGHGASCISFAIL
ncbi:hypothetical protein Cgig2_004556 [Carnegiea gigantea]|uniref:Uncharacterized protein n=1 Tax=Carnegiea gigantea TaxID=171969 RepID=A0A9Q1JK94_9CARY|nr:hypothetical protein Cgig2_004556 [Carnegiea gigantea]